MTRLVHEVIDVKTGKVLFLLAAEPNDNGKLPVLRSDQMKIGKKRDMDTEAIEDKPSEGLSIY